MRGFGAAGGTAKLTAETVANIKTTQAAPRTDRRVLRLGADLFGFVMVGSKVLPCRIRDTSSATPPSPGSAYCEA
jgi:hypothetical protein